MEDSLGGIVVDSAVFSPGGGCGEVGGVVVVGADIEIICWYVRVVLSGHPVTQ